MERPGAAAGHQHERAGIEPALGRHALDGKRHRGRCDLEHPGGGLHRVHAERIGDAGLHRRDRGRRIERHRSAEEAVGGDPAEHQVGVGHSRRCSAGAVAGGPRARAGAFRPDAERALRVGPGDRPAAGADLEDVHHRDLHRQALLVAADLGAPRGQGLAAVDHPRLGGGAAHVEGDRVLDPHRAGERAPRDDPRRRSRFEHVDAVVPRLGDVVEPAGRLDDQKRAGEGLRFEMFADLVQIAAHARPDIGVRGRRRAALELAVFLRQLVGRSDENAGQTGFEDRLGAFLMVRVAVAVQQQDRDRLDVEPGELRPQRAHLVLVERGQRLALGQHPLVELEAHRALDQRTVLLEEQVVGIGPVDPADLVDVAKAFGDHQRGAGAGPFQHRVDGDRRAVQEKRRVGERDAGPAHPGGDPVHEMRRRRKRLAEPERARRRIEGRDVGERAADVGGEPQPAGNFRFRHASSD